MKQLDCKPEEFLMIGNSIKSDILPILQIGGYAVYVPFHVTWQHEKVENEVSHPNFIQINKIQDVTCYL